MSDTHYVLGTVVQPNWLNDVNDFVYHFPSQTGNSGKYLTTNGTTMLWGTIPNNDTFLNVKQFGAVGNGVADDTTAFQNAINAACPGNASKSLYVPAGTYNISAALVKAQSNSGLTLIGESPTSCFINFTNSVGRLKIVGGSGAITNTIISNLSFQGTSATTLIEICGQGGQKIQECNFGLSGFGVVFHNEDVGSFTEYCTLEDCNFAANCNLPIWYRKTNGDPSFNGSGLLKGNTINTSAGQIVCQIDNGCRPYNAPFSAQVWCNSSSVIINDSNTALRSTFWGNLTIERFVGTMTLANSGTEGITYAGQITCNNENMAFGKLFQCSFHTLLASGALQVRDCKYSKQQNMTTGANTITGIPSFMKGGACAYYLHIVGSNYDYRYKVETFNNATSGLAAITATFSTFNVAGYGAPSFSLDGTANLVITNGGFPASGVVVQMDVLQIGQSMDNVFIGA